MYIPPFVLGIIVTVIFEIGILVVIAATGYARGKK